MKIFCTASSVVNICVFVFVLAALSGCSLPRIMILKDPLTPEEHINLGVSYEKQGEFDQAINEYKKAAGKNPVGYLYLGNVYFQKNDPLEAEKNYEMAIKKDPQNSDAYNNLAWLYYTRNNNLDRAESLAQKAVQLDPGRDLFRDTLEKIRALKRMDSGKSRP